MERVVGEFPNTPQAFARAALNLMTAEQKLRNARVATEAQNYSGGFGAAVCSIAGVWIARG